MKDSTLTGEGQLLFAGVSLDVPYEIRGPVQRGSASSTPVRPGRGWLTASTDLARDLFHAGRARLRLEDGRDIRIVAVAHTDGEAKVFFDVET
jgi:hypothetical protein